VTTHDKAQFTALGFTASKPLSILLVFWLAGSTMASCTSCVNAPDYILVLQCTKAAMAQHFRNTHCISVSTIRVFRVSSHRPGVLGIRHRVSGRESYIGEKHETNVKLKYSKPTPASMVGTASLRTHKQHQHEIALITPCFLLGKSH